jgi:hypothetical protein
VLHGIFIGSLDAQPTPSYGTVNSPCPTQTLAIYSGITPSRSNALVCVLPQVYGAGGLVGTDNGGPLSATSTHEVHYQASSVRSFAPLNEEIGIQLNNLPLAAPVAQYIFQGGAVVATTQDLGPILTDTAESLGKGRFYLGATYQHFEFDKVDSIPLNAVDAVFHHEYEECIPSDPYVPDPDPTACLSTHVVRYVNDVIATRNHFSLKMDQFAVTGAYGATDRLDLSVVIPVVSARLGVTSDATIMNLGPTSIEPCDQEHIFAGTSDPTACLNQSFPNSSSAAGMGDMLIRAKYRTLKGEKSAVAVGMELRLPTGDAYNYLGTGTWGIRPFGIFSMQFGRISPHGSISFQGNGDSLLAADITAPNVQKAHLPDVIIYTGGLDAMITHRFGAAVDFLGQTLLSGPRVAVSTYPGYVDADFPSTPGFTIDPQPDIRTFTSTFTIASVAPGIKLVPVNNLTITASALFRINDAGLHARPAPMLGMSYSF